MENIKLITFVILVLGFSSCSISGSDTNESKIVGQWEWIRSTGGIAGQVLTPDSAGVPGRHFNFNSDYTFSFFRADTLVQTGTYSLEEKDENIIIDYNTEKEDFSLNQRVKFKGNDTLILADECYDCYINTYIRMQ